ncbi:MAG: hypothetical protein NVS4B6_27540 [Mycobacterium sp.]
MVSAQDKADATGLLRATSSQAANDRLWRHANTHTLRWDLQMGIKVALEHRTSYTFDRLVEVFPHVVRLRPAPHSRTPIEA